MLRQEIMLSLSFPHCEPTKAFPPRHDFHLHIKRPHKSLRYTSGSDFPWQGFPFNPLSRFFFRSHSPYIFVIFTRRVANQSCFEGVMVFSICQNHDVSILAMKFRFIGSKQSLAIQSFISPKDSTSAHLLLFEMQTRVLCSLSTAF